MSDEIRELRSRLEAMETDTKELEENYQFAIGSGGRVGKDIKELKRRVTAIEDFIKTLQANKQHKPKTKEID